MTELWLSNINSKLSHCEVSLATESIPWLATERSSLFFDSAFSKIIFICKKKKKKKKK